MDIVNHFGSIFYIIGSLTISTGLLYYGMKEWKKKEKQSLFKIYSSMIGSLCIVLIATLYGLDTYIGFSKEVVSEQPENAMASLAMIEGFITELGEIDGKEGTRPLVVDGYRKFIEDLQHTDLNLVEGIYYRIVYDADKSIIVSAEELAVGK